MKKVCLNGKFIDSTQPVLMNSNRGFRYGDALFETMKVSNGKIHLLKYHFERLYKGLRLLEFKRADKLTLRKISGLILELCQKNKCEELARVRFTVFRGNGSLYDLNENLQFIIECDPLKKSVIQFNDSGFLIDIYPEARKSCDTFSNLKSANYLPYIMASRYARKNKLDECLVYNVNDRLADATIANIFLVKGKHIMTPALTEGCVNGVMRRYLIEKLSASRFNIREGDVSINDLKSSDEIFLTNAIYGIRWVRQFRNKKYTNVQALAIFKKFIEPLNS